MRYIRRGIALILSMLLILSTAAAEIPFLQHAAGWTLEGVPLEVILSANVISLMPYDEDRLAMLKPVTDALSLRIRTGENEGSVTILVGRSEALTMAYRENQTQLSCIPELAFTSQEDPMGMLLGGSTAATAPYGLRDDGESLLDDGWELLVASEQFLEPYGVRKNVKTNITDMGLARSCTDYTVQKGSVEEMKQLLLENCPEGWLRDIISGMTFSGKQTLRVYRDENGIPLRMEYNGTCGPEGNLRTVKLVWRLRRDDIRRDEITLTSPAKTGTNKNNLEFTRVVSRNKQNELVVEGEFTYTVTLDKQTTTRKGEFSLTNAGSETVDVITGSMTLQQKAPGEDSFSGICFEPELTLSGTQEDPRINGSLKVSTLNGKNVLDCASIYIDLRRGEGVDWTEAENIIDMDALSPEEMEALRSDAARGVAASLIRPLIILLGEDADWFFRDMLPEQIKKITDAANAVVYQ